jgi:hypothetical protein
VPANASTLKYGNDTWLFGKVPRVAVRIIALASPFQYANQSLGGAGNAARDRTHTVLAVTIRDEEGGPQHLLRFVIGDLPRASTHRMVLSPLSGLAVAQLAKQAGRTSKDLHTIRAAIRCL